MRFRWRRAQVAAFVFGMIATLALSAAAAAAPNATINAEFGDSCRDFGAESTKDISHVVIHYADGRVIKDERITTSDYSIDGGPGDEITMVSVKSGTTSETFACAATNSPPTAVLERKAGMFDVNNSEGTWTTDDCIWGECGYLGPGTGSPYPDESAVSFSGINSTDPDNDIVSWSLDFGDGTTPAGGSWVTEPPVEVVHDYDIECMCIATLTVTDSLGQSSSDPIVVSVAFFQGND